MIRFLNACNSLVAVRRIRYQRLDLRVLFSKCLTKYLLEFDYLLH